MHKNPYDSLCSRSRAVVFPESASTEPGPLNYWWPGFEKLQSCGNFFVTEASLHEMSY